MKGGDDDDDDVWNASAVILDIDSGVYTLTYQLLWWCYILYVCMQWKSRKIPLISENKKKFMF